MNTLMIRRLVGKDWAFQRVPVLLALLAGVVSLLLVASGSEGAFYAGTVLLITVVICFGVQLAIATVITERTEGNLPFVMSLPVSVAEHTAATLLANLLLFLLPWFTLGAGTLLVIRLAPGVPDGLIPFAVLLLLELLAGYALVLGVALVSASLGWTIVAVVTGNLLVQVFMYWAFRLPGITATMATESVVWHRQAIALMAGLLGATTLILLVAWRVRLSKKDLV